MAQQEIVRLSLRRNLGLRSGKIHRLISESSVFLRSLKPIFQDLMCTEESSREFIKTVDCSGDSNPAGLNYSYILFRNLHFKNSLRYSDAENVSVDHGLEQTILDGFVYLGCFHV